MCSGPFVIYELFVYNLYIYIYIYSEMVDSDEFDKMIRISGKIDKWDTYNGFSSNISFFIQEFLRTKHFLLVFYIQAIEEIDKITRKNKGLKGGESGSKFKRQIKEGIEREVDVGLNNEVRGYCFWL